MTDYSKLQQTYFEVSAGEKVRLLADWISSSDQPFNVKKHLIDPTCPPETRWVNEQQYVILCEGMVKKGLLRYARGERGWYQPVKVALNRMDFDGVTDERTDIWLPFGLSDEVELYPGNIVIFAGMKSAGKTAIALNILRENESKFDEINYFNSEMGAAEMKKRLGMFGRTIDMWQANFYSQYDNFDGAVQPGINTLNVIDFLEIHDEFYAIGKAIKAIHDNLKESTCIIFLQKNPGLDVGLGGWRSTETCRLYVAIDKGTAKIVDAKNWVDPLKNPNGMKRDFKIYSGTQLSWPHGWYKHEDEQ